MLLLGLVACVGNRLLQLLDEEYQAVDLLGRLIGRGRVVPPSGCQFFGRRFERRFLLSETNFGLLQLRAGGTYLFVTLLQAVRLEFHLPLEVGFVSVVLYFRGGGRARDVVQLFQPFLQNFRGGLRLLQLLQELGFVLLAFSLGVSGLGECDGFLSFGPS